MTMHDGDDFEHDGARFRVTFQPDDTQDAPWEREDGHGPVSDWRYHSLGQGTKPPKAPGERILHWDDGYYRTYDFAEAVKIARRDGWMCNADALALSDPNRPKRTKREIAARAADEDFRRLADWCADRWSYVGCIVTLLDDFGDPIEDATASLWGIESDAGDYFDEATRELADEVLANMVLAA